MDYSFCQLIGKEKLIFNTISTVRVRKQMFIIGNAIVWRDLSRLTDKVSSLLRHRSDLMQGPLCRLSGLSDDGDGWLLLLVVTRLKRRTEGGSLLSVWSQLPWVSEQLHSCNCLWEHGAGRKCFGSSHDAGRQDERGRISFMFAKVTLSVLLLVRCNSDATPSEFIERISEPSWWLACCFKIEIVEIHQNWSQVEYNVQVVTCDFF